MNKTIALSILAAIAVAAAAYSISSTKVPSAGALPAPSTVKRAPSKAPDAMEKTAYSGGSERVTGEQLQDALSRQQANPNIYRRYN